MPVPSELLTLAQGLAGVFENREQAIADPAWYVSVRLWHRPVKLFADDSITLFAEQANLLYPNQAYRQRLLQLRRSPDQPDQFQVQYYGFKQPGQFKGAGENPQLLAAITADQIEFLPGCVLDLIVQTQPTGTHFVAVPPPGACCRFQYDGKIGQVELGFELTPTEYLTFDKGINPETGEAIWGALMGPYRYRKVQTYAVE